MIKKGPLSNKDKEYIESNREVEVKKLAKKLSRAEATVSKYLNSLQPKKKSSHGFEMFATNDRGSTVMTQSASQLGDDFKKTTLSTKTRNCITSIRDEQ